MQSKQIAMVKSSFEEVKPIADDAARSAAWIGSIPSGPPPARKRHVDYGVEPEHYAVVGDALLWTLEKGLGPKWTPELGAAWTDAYATLSGFIIGEAYGVKQSAAE